MMCSESSGSRNSNHSRAKSTGSSVPALTDRSAFVPSGKPLATGLPLEWVDGGVGAEETVEGLSGAEEFDDPLTLFTVDALV